MLINQWFVEKSFFKDAKFVKVADSGAMGNGGEVCIVKGNGNIYSGNYAYGELGGRKLIQSFSYILDEEYDVLKNTGKSTDGRFYHHWHR